MLTQAEKRKRVMARSMKLGRCVCNPRLPCPCPVFLEKKICTCAGESIPVNNKSGPIRLTEHVRSAGCAGKISQEDLARVLSGLTLPRDPRVLVGLETGDDAGVFELAPGVNLVQTVDVFTPTVDDAFTFGRIAACNSLSDIYAMGGRPLTALSIIGFPIHDLPHETMTEILRGGQDVLAEAGVILLGGHSIDEPEIKFGFAVTGVVEKAQMTTNAAARPGDCLILTKPLGTGIVTFAAQVGRASAAAIATATKSMCTLNRTAAGIMAQHGVRATTDVTGFGLLGHLARMARESGVTAEVIADALPLLPEALEAAREGIYSGANDRNLAYSEALTQFDPDVSDAMRVILTDPQTSGGLLMAAPADRLESLLSDLRAAGVKDAAVIGCITEPSAGAIHVRASAPACLKGEPATPPACCKKNHPPKMESHMTEAQTECCAHTSGESKSTGKALDLFQEFMSRCLQPGALDAVSKELIAVALALGVNCAPCSKMHVRKALGMGIGREELEEAAALAIAFGGCKTLMLWKQLEKDIPDASPDA